MSSMTTANLALAQPEPTHGMTHWNINESHLKLVNSNYFSNGVTWIQLFVFSPPALESAKCKALPGHYYDGLLRKCVMCAEVCGRHPAECWQHCHSESQMKYSVMLSASTSCFIKKKRFENTGWSGWENSNRHQEDEHCCNALIKRWKQTKQKKNFETL